MPETEYRQKLEKNIVKYSWYKVFTKRLYLPLITIQLVNVGKVTVEELALIVVITSIVQMGLQLPAGYFADKFGNRRSIILGASISVLSPLLYIFMPNFWGGLIASVMFFGGYAFQSGAIEAFIHDTLIALKRENEYSKVMGRAQTYGLVGNIILIALIPATYALDPSVPFVLGFISLLVMLWLTVSFVYPRVEKSFTAPKSPLIALKSIVTAENVALFLFAGLTAGLSNKGGEFRELVLQDLGVAVSLFGLILAAGSLAGAVFGWYVHLLDRLKPLTFYLVDLVIMSGCLVAIGATRNVWVAVASFTLFAAYTRVRLIIFQSKILQNITHVYKATLLSALSLFSGLGDIVAITLLAKAVGLYSYTTGHLVFGVVIFGVGFVIWAAMLVELKTRSSSFRS